jgi:hypothetical protein
MIATMHGVTDMTLSHTIAQIAELMRKFGISQPSKAYTRSIEINEFDLNEPEPVEIEQV